MSELRLSDGHAPRESLLLRDGLYCGRRFEAEGGHALWFVEEDQLKIFGPDGRVLQVMHNVGQSRPSMRMAA